MASYPNSLRPWATKRDWIDPIFALHFNQSQDEISATQRTIGIRPQIATNDPAERTPNYTTVANRISQMARAQPMIAYRGIHEVAQIEANEYFRPTLTASEDTHNGAITTGYRIPQTGFWVFTAKADWLPVESVTDKPIIRMISLEIDGEDCGIRDVITQSVDIIDDMTTMVTWQETLEKGTTISVALTVVNPNTPAPDAVAHVYLRAHLVRCLDRGGPGIPTPEFEPEPPPPEEPPPGPRPEPRPPDRPPSRPVSSGDGVGLGIVTYDEGGHVTSTNHNPYNWPSDVDPSAWPWNR
ncbi:hypothetical protein [Herbidospora galbida]|uniref:hypothetical protein n=1 Tax=Herbidospora galbida TaxID=2575442 RepID=UPI00148597DA|nr:hypothetical protein [Herbidospora galbida]